MPALLLLIWVLAVSAAFQTYRAKHMHYITKQKNRLRAHLMLFAPHGVVHFMFWVKIIWFVEIDSFTGLQELAFLFTLTATCAAILFWHVPYKNNDADFGRWLEYIMTAPIQIAIIAMSVWLRDRSTLIALVGAQACMLLCGVVIEGCIEDIYVTNRKGSWTTENHQTADAIQDQETKQHVVEIADKRVQKTKGHSRHVVFATLVIAWVTFALIWFVIITQFWRQADIAGHCDKCASYPAVCAPVAAHVPKLESVEISTPTEITVPVPTIVGNETIMVDTIVIMNVKSFIVQNSTEAPSPVSQCTECLIKGQDDFCRLDDNSECTGRNQIPSAVTFIMASQCLAFALFGVVLTAQLAFSFGQHGTEKVKSAWYNVAVVYSLLSVTAKTSLEIGFLVMLSQMPESTVLA